MLSTRNLIHHFNSKKHIVFPDLNCESGQSLLILGPSGSGKSTLLHLLCGLLKPESGNISILNTDIVKLNSSETDAFRGKYIGVMLQKAHFISSLNVVENLLLFQSLAGLKKDIFQLKELLQNLGIESLENQKVQTLSQGEAQRLNLARALIQKPALILADEPTSSLDDQHAERIACTLQQHAETMNATLIIVTHDYRLKSIFQNHIQLS